MKHVDRAVETPIDERLARLIDALHRIDAEQLVVLVEASSNGAAIARHCRAAQYHPILLLRVKGMNVD